MADVVRSNLERMVPELEELRETNIFSAEEIRSIVKRRRAFEYRLQNRAVDKKDFIDYITYELNLELLRRKRKERVGTSKRRSKSEYTGIRRIHSLFVRALRKFQNDIRLWLQYADFCARTGSSRTMSRLFPKALQLHPKSVGLWIHAAGFEISCNNNYDAARIILQRGLRINPDASKMWLEYFRMELLYVEKIALRRTVLGLMDEPNASMKQILQGAIPKAVFSEAMSKRPDDVEFAIAFYELCGEMSSKAASESISSFVESHCESTFGPTRSSYWSALANAQYRREGDRAAAARTFERGLTQCEQRAALCEDYVRFLIKTDGKSESCLLKVSTLCENASRSSSDMSFELYAVWIDVIMRIGSHDKLHDALRSFTDAYPKHASAWTTRLDIAIRSSAVQCVGESDDVETLFRRAIRSVPSKDALLVHERFLNWSVAHERRSDIVRDRFRRALRDIPCDQNLCSQYLSWAGVQDDRAYFREAEEIVLKKPYGRPSDLDMFLKCIRMTRSDPDHVEHARRLFEQALRSSDIMQDARAWIGYISLVRSTSNDLETLGQLKWRASTHLSSTEMERVSSAVL